MWPNSKETVALINLMEMLNGKLHFCAVKNVNDEETSPNTKKTIIKVSD